MNSVELKKKFLIFMQSGLKENLTENGLISVGAISIWLI